MSKTIIVSIAFHKSATLEKEKFEFNLVPAAVSWQVWAPSIKEGGKYLDRCQENTVNEDPGSRAE